MGKLGVLGVCVLWACGSLGVATGCSAASDEATAIDSESEEALSKRVDLKQYYFVNASLATGADAKKLKAALSQPKKLESGDVFAGLTEDELDGKPFRATTPLSLVYGILCTTSGGDACSVVTVASATDLQSKQQRGFTVPTQVRLHGRLAQAVASALPAIGAQRVGGGTRGYAPLQIVCTESSGRVNGAPATKCDVPIAGGGTALTFREMLDMPEDGAKMSEATLRAFIAKFYPKG